MMMPQLRPQRSDEPIRQPYMMMVWPRYEPKRSPTDSAFSTETGMPT
jgi:hypothetical protein